MQESKIGDWVIYKNNQLIAFNKPPVLPVQPDKSDEKSLLQLGEIYCRHPLNLIHRVDRPASGIVLFAKNKSALAHLNAQFQDRTVRKTYLAIVKNEPPAKEGSLVHFLMKQHKSNKSEIQKEQTAHNQKAEMTYKVITSSEHYFLLEVDLLTGRHHQIRAQLAAIGCPIKGDVKYGARRSNADRSIHLHAWKLEFTHPVSGERVHLKAAPPLSDPLWASFEEVLKNID